MNKSLIFNGGIYKYYTTIWNNLSATVTESDYLTYGMDDLTIIPQTAWQELTGTVELSYYTDSATVTEAQFSIETDPFTLSNELGTNFSVVEYTDNPSQEDSAITAETDPYSVYDFISETPEVLVYTELTDDVEVSTTVEPFTLTDEFEGNTVKVIEYTNDLLFDESIVGTETEPFDLYEEFGDSVDILYYTDDDSVSEADLILEANWSPVDELEGDIEIVTWTDEDSPTTQRFLEMTAIPQPQFIKLVNPKRLYGELENVIINDLSETYKFKEEARYFFTDNNAINWYVFDNVTETFVVSDASTNDLILQNGMTFDEVNSLDYDDWKKWTNDYINIGIFLKDNPRDTIVSVVDNLAYKDFLPRNSSTLSDASLYILNTTAKIELELKGSAIEGVLSDADLTRVQYRVSLNGSYYYPNDGSFTALDAPPQNINIILSSSDILIDQNNTVRVDFKDSFGTTDYWQASFIGTYSGLMFKDISGDYYSTELGGVLKYLDFGTIIAGQTTIEHEIILKNQYGYDVENVRIDVNTAKFPSGMSAELSKSLAPFDAKEYLELGTMLNGEETSFFIRLATQLGVTPDSNGSFDIIVRADKVV